MAKDRSINALNGNLFDLIERLADPDLHPDEAEALAMASRSVAALARQITDNERMLNERAQIVAEHAPERLVELLMPKELGNG